MKDLAVVALVAVFLICSLSSAASAIQYSYDDGGRLVAVFYGGEKSIAYSYDVNGNLVSYSARGGVKRGDVNLDDVVDLTDALVALRLLSGRAMTDTDIAGYLESQVDVMPFLGLAEITYILQRIAELR